MRCTIDGTIAQCAHLELDRDETVWCSRGSMVSMSPGIDWRLRIPGGVGGAVRRSMSGEGAALMHVRAAGDGERIDLSANAPGHIETWDLSRGPVIATRGSFLAAWGDDVDITVTIARRAGAAFFGGAGLFLQRISGRGTALIAASGDFVRRELGPGERLLVSTGNLAAFSADVDYAIQGVGGCLKMMFGREGIFMTRLTGPPRGDGTVLLQTLKRGVVSAAKRSGG